MKHHPVLTQHTKNKSNSSTTPPFTQSLKPQSPTRATSSNVVVDKAKNIIDACNNKINTLNSRCSTIEESNKILQDEINTLQSQENVKRMKTKQYKHEIDVQKKTLSQWQQKLQQLTTEIVHIKEKQKESEKEYKNKLLSINDTLSKVYGDTITKLKYNKMHTKFVVFTEKINHLFYYDESGPKLIMVRDISTDNDLIATQLDRPWFLITGKRRSALFVAQSAATRDKWVTFIRASLDNQEDQMEDEFSVLTSLLCVDYEVESKDDRQTTQFANTPPVVTNRKRNLSTTFSMQHMPRLLSSRSAARHSKTQSMTLSRAHTMMNMIGRGSNATRAQSGSVPSGSYNAGSVLLDTLLREPVDDHVHVIVTYDIKDGQVAEFIKAIKPIIVATNKEEGCIRYNIHKDKKSKCRLVMVEEWDSQKSLTNHLKRDHLNVYRDLMKKHEVHKETPAVYLCNQVF